MTAHVRAGDLTRRITIQQRATTRDTFGQQTTTWTDLLSCWAQIEPMSGRELITAQAVNSEITHTVTILYRSQIKPAMRVVYQGRIFNIVSVTDQNSDHVITQMTCSEGMNQG